MKQAAVVLGIIGGILGLIVGISVSGWIAFTGWIGTEVPDAVREPENAGLLRTMGVISPVLAIAGGAMSVLRPFLGAVFLVASAAGMWWAFGFGFFTMFPIALTGLGGVLGLAGAASREPGGMTRR